MIIKSLPHKKTNFVKILDYVLRDYEDREDCFAVFHNFSSTHKKTCAREFIRNYGLKDKRKNGNALYHEIMSFSAKDEPFLTAGKIERLTRKYIGLRADKTLCVAAMHRDTSHLHVHLMFSANEYLSNKAHRLSKARFKEVQSEMERYQIEHFPELEHSLVFQYREKKKEEKEITNSPKAKKGSVKERLTERMRSVFDRAKGLDDFLGKLKAERCTAYRQRGKLKGVLYEGNKHTFRSIGVLPEHLKTLERFDDLKCLSSRNSERGLDLER